VWHIHGVRSTHGKEEFDSEVENPDFSGLPVLTVQRTIESGDVNLFAADSFIEARNPEADNGVRPHRRLPG